MTKEQFKDCFEEVLANLPSEVVAKIQKYWKSNKPILILEDDKIDLYTDEAACTDGWFTFCFRPFVYENAPENIVRTVIQHELGHVYLRSQQSAEKRLSSNTQEPGTCPLSQTINKYCLTYREEQTVRTLNDSWGGDEAALNNWILNNMRKTF